MPFHFSSFIVIKSAVRASAIDSASTRIRTIASLLRLPA